MQPLTDAELAEFIARDDARTPGEWEARGGKLLVKGTIGGVAYDFTYLDDAEWAAACTRMGRRMAEELLERRQANRHLSHDVEEFYQEDADAQDNAVG